MANEKTEQVMIRVTPDLAQQIKALADRDERTVSQTIRLAMKRFIETELVPS